MCSRYDHFGSTTNRAFSGLNVEEKGRLIVVEDLIVISVLDAIEGELNAGLMPVVTGWGDAHGLGRVDHDSGDTNLKVQEGAESVVGIVDLIELLLEGEEITALEQNVSSAHFGTVIRYELFN